jgi:uncharacterized protein YlaI
MNVQCQLCGLADAEESVTFIEEGLIYWLCPQCLDRLKKRIGVIERKTETGEISLYIK